MQQSKDGGLRLHLLVEEQFMKRKKSGGKSWRMDESYFKVKDKWNYAYESAYEQASSIDFLLTKTRQGISAHKFLIQSFINDGKPEPINKDNSGANTSAIKRYDSRNYSKINIRQGKYINNILKQDHRMIDRIIIQGLGFKDFESARIPMA